MADAARAMGIGLTVTHEGKTYELADVDTDMLAMFEAWLEDNAFRKIERTRFRTDDRTYRERLMEVTRLVAANAFRYNGQLAQEAFQSEEGQKYVLWLQLAKKDSEVTEELAADIWDKQRDIVIAKQEAMRGEDPNAKAPEAK